ncbi:MAG: amidohydrolase family protein [Thermodesulfobacteriota bacterium]|nr:amidohydrolase family protein [Thermodesulfobacteriota bacterium]
MDVKAVDCLINDFSKEGLESFGKEIIDVMKWWGMEKRLIPYTPEEFIAIMDEAGVEKVVAPSMKMRSYRKGDFVIDTPWERIADLIQKHPDRFIGLYGINPMMRMEGVREMEKCIKEYGFKGGYIHTYGFGIPLNHRLYYPYYAKCEELGLPVGMQTGHSAEFMPNEMGRPIHLDDVAVDFADLTLIAMHMGWPWVEELIALGWKHPNLYICSSGHRPRYWDKSFFNFLRTRGQDKVLYGTDYPLLFHKESLEEIMGLEVKETVIKKFLYDNAKKAFKF